MAYFALLWKARTIEKYRSKYEKEKIDSIIAANAELPRHTFCQKWKLYRYDSQKKFNRTFRRWCPEGSRVSNFFVYLRTDQTFANFLVKSVIGFVGGIVLTYFWFMFFVFQLSISLIHATIMSSIIGVSLTLGLAFSYRIRCLVFLLIPQFFSRVGRYTLTCYALVLILTGPATNTLKNSEVLSESLACGQEQVKSSVINISKAMEKPLHLMKDTFDETMKRLQYLAAKTKELMVKIHRLTMGIAHVLQSSLAWLTSTEDVCNAKLGTPYDHCVRVLGQGKPDMKKAQGMLNFDHFVKAVCFNLKSVDSMCVVGEFAKSSIVATVRKKLQTYSDRVRATVSASARVRRSHGCCNASRTASQAAAGIVTEIRHRADPLLTWLSWSSCLTSLFLLLIIFRAKYYQQMFETRSRFDNRYVTKELRDLDLKRLRQGRETVLPLNTRERAKYVSTTSFRLLASERVHLTRSIVFMVITTFKLLIHMVADYSLYWVLMNIRFHGRFQTPLMPGDPTAGIQVSGSGPLAGIVRVLMEALSIPLAVPAPSPISCLPNPHPPDFQRYAQIGVLILLLWLFALFEPYGLRLRHVIMGHYQPERARARAEWLYNHIIRTRGCFLKYARRKLHREYKYSSEERYTFKRWLNNFIPCRCLRLLLQIGPDEPHCLLCGTKQIQNDSDTNLKRCDTPSCPGTYCARCFMDIGQLCTICLSPEDYGDISDISLEKSSSEDSDSGDSDNQRDVNKPLMGTTGLRINKDENFPQRNRTTNRCERLSKSKNNGNQEATTLNYDSLKQKIDANCDFIQRFNADVYDKIEEDQSVNESTIPVIVRDKERQLKSVDVRKEKLSGVINTMKLLTTKMEDNKYNNNKWSMHKSKTFEYLVMNLIQPVDIFKKALIVRHTKRIDGRFHLNSDDKRETMKQLIPFLCTYSINDIITNNIINNPITKELPSNLCVKNESEVPVFHDNEHVMDKSLERSKRNITSITRNMARSLAMTKSQTEDLVSRLRKRRINLCNKNIHKQKRHKTHYSYLILKTTCSFRPQIKTKCRIYNINKESFSKNLPKKVNSVLNTNKYVDNIGKCFANNNALIQETKCHTTNKVQQLSNNIVTDCSSNIKPSDLIYSTDEEPNKMMNMEKIEDNILKIADCKTDDKQYKKRGFYSYLWTQTKIQLTKHKLTKFMQKNDPILSNIVTNHKRRKKYQVSEPKISINTAKRIVAKQDSDDARNFRISLYLKDHQEWFKRQFQKESKVLKDNIEMRHPKEKTNNLLLNFKEKNDKRKIKEAEAQKKAAQKELVRQLKLQAKAEEKVKRNLKKEAIRRKGNVDVVNETLKANQNKIQNNKNETRLIIEKYKRPGIQEMSLKKTDTYAPPPMCVSNCLNFFDFNDPQIEIPEENIDLDLDEIFADDVESKTIKKGTGNEMTLQPNKRKHPEQPLLLPINRSYVTQMPAEYKKKLDSKICSPIKIIIPSNKCIDKSSATKTKEYECDVKECGKKVYKKGDDRRQNIIRSCNTPEIPQDNEWEMKGIKIKKSPLKKRKIKTKKDGSPSPVKSCDLGRKINEKYDRKNMIRPICKNDTTQTALVNMAIKPFGDNSKNCLKTFRSNQKNKRRSTLSARSTASEVLYGMRKPVDRLKDFYGIMFGGSREQTKSEKTQIGDVKGETNNCRKPLSKKIQVKAKIKNCKTQYNAGDCAHKIRDAGTAMSADEKCTCSAQCSIHYRKTHTVNVGTMHHNALGKMMDKETQYERLTDENDPIEDSRSTVSDTDSQITVPSETEETKTDTTICSVTEIDYAKPYKHKRNKVNVITKTNQSTITENVLSVDVSTITSDWWSPIVEKKVVTMRKHNRRKGTKNLEKGDKMEADEKCVSFKSYARIIPSKGSDIMSPCRYLLESQKYYNELYSTGIFYPSLLQKPSIPKGDKGNDTGRVCHRARRSLKTKRLEESYSPRKRMQTSHFNLNPVTWRPAEKKDSPSVVLRRNSCVHAGWKPRKLRDSHDKEMGGTLKRSERLHASRNFIHHDEDAGPCISTSSY